jgi:hypothetical protein
MLTLCTWCVLLFFYDILRILVQYIWYQSTDPRVLLPQGSHFGIFAIMFSWRILRRINLEDIYNTYHSTRGMNFSVWFILLSEIRSVEDRVSY